MPKQNIKLKSLIDKQQIAAKLKEVACALDLEYSHKSLVLLTVLKGAICLVADLIRFLTIPCDIEVVQCASYGTRGEQRGELRIFGLERADLRGRDVLIVDDIFDSGHTLSSLLHAVQEMHPASVKSLVLLKKKIARELKVVPDYPLFEIENRFVVGYGLDYKERFRGLDGIYLLEQEDA